ncbi:MAG TPA: tRNA uracil 4-sulfurtransferase ThiI [Candidatus Krumholzibacteria bacterium]|nr:tRNA uracil 4-sulfurtransferase ThiI [Candidatus Krumholzibacteria bacterium]HPD70440.1 tRNA uracil 4-sulfurtransferase ThiI [Candidatus Krumholzibacteria bacterium]HRY39860.1 tRNA uracil 4-sulfurtransferase ThiI [Candidatus Krumholzibacteria bacterium]
MNHPASVLVVTYAEIALKRKNRPVFQLRLLNNMRRALAGEPIAGINHVESRYLVWLDDPGRAEICAQKLERVFGIRWLSPAVSIPKSAVGPQLAAVQAVAVDLARRDVGDARTFKVETRRSDRGFPFDSQQINRLVGDAVGAVLGLPAKMTRPDFTVNVLVLRERLLVFTAKRAGASGLPSGTGGRVCCLLSGGIDSPVAAWLLMRRGCRPTLIHFYSGRTYREADAGKIVDLARVLAGWSPVPLTLWLVPVVPYEARALDHVSDAYDMLMFRRFMVKAAATIAHRENCLALVTGDSLGQVASQTLHNLAAIAPDVGLPIFRPLIGMDKEQTTVISKQIGAFPVSIRPYRDCCSIRSPRPVLNARPDVLCELSAAMDLPGAVRDSLAAAARLVVGPGGILKEIDRAGPVAPGA